MEQCPECGAKKVNDKDCFAQLGEIIAWEYDDPALLAEHFLTVASYNLQHPSQFTSEALTGLRESLAAYLEGCTTIDQIRRKGTAMFEGGTKVMRETPLG